MQLREVLQSTDLMTHQIELSDVDDRRLWLAELCAGRSVLHVGCCDVPVFDPNTNLHVFLASHTDRLDGLDISEDGIDVVRRHVDGEYFTDPAAVTREYDLVLVPEVLEHTPNPGDFLSGIFSVRAQQYLFTVPHIQWYERTRRDGRLFHESVHGDHKAWYSPYTLLNTLRPFIDEEHDEVEVFLLSTTGSVAALLTRAFAPQPFAAPPGEAALGAEAALELAGSRAAEAREASALRVLAAAHARSPEARLVHAQLEILLGLGQTMEALRVSVAWMRDNPADLRCKELCADVMEALGDLNSARDLRAAAQRGRQ